MLRRLLDRMTAEPPVKPDPKPADPDPPPAPVTSEPQARKIRVLFLCYGNSCRSPMAEGLARSYGTDVLIVESAGVAPINRIDAHSIKVMKERNIDISGTVPRGIEDVRPETFDLIVNMSGRKLSTTEVPVDEWKVPDPVGQDEEAFRRTAEQLEQMVMRLILQVRLKQHPVAKAQLR